MSDHRLGEGIRTEFLYYPPIECLYTGEYPEGRKERIFGLELATITRLSFRVKVYNWLNKNAHYVMSYQEAMDLVGDNMLRIEHMQERADLFKRHVEELCIIFEKHEFSMIRIHNLDPLVNNF